MTHRDILYNEFQTLANKVREQEREIAKLKANQRTTVPIYDGSQLPADAIEGQVAILINTTEAPPSIPPQVLEGTSAYVRITNSLTISNITKTFLDLDNGNLACITNDRTGSEETITNSSWSGNNFSIDRTGSPDTIFITSPGIYYVSMVVTRNPTPGSEFDNKQYLTVLYAGAGTPPYKAVYTDTTLIGGDVTPDYGFLDRMIVVKESSVPVSITPWVYQNPGVDWEYPGDGTSIIYQIFKLRDITGVTGGGGGTLGDAIRFNQDNTGDDVYLQIETTNVANGTKIYATGGGDFAVGTKDGVGNVYVGSEEGNVFLGGMPDGTFTSGVVYLAGAGGASSATLYVQGFPNGINLGGATAAQKVGYVLWESDGFEMHTKTGGMYFYDDSGANIQMVSTGSVYLQGTYGVQILGNGGASSVIEVNPGIGGKVQFFGSGGSTKPTITGSRSANAALASLLTALASFGLLVDSST